MSEHTPTPLPAGARAVATTGATRRSMIVAAGATAAVAGAGAFWWQETRQTAEDDPLAAFWNQPFPTPQEGAPPLTMKTFRGQRVLLNFWATWCPPCVRELPLLDAFARDRAAEGWRVVALAVDEAPAVRDFLRRMPLGLHVALAGGPGLAWSRALGNQAGGLPFTVVFDAEGRIRHTKAGEAKAADLSGWAAAT